MEGMKCAEKEVRVILEKGRCGFCKEEIEMGDETFCHSVLNHNCYKKGFTTQDVKDCMNENGDYDCVWGLFTR